MLQSFSVARLSVYFCKQNTSTCKSLLWMFLMHFHHLLESRLGNSLILECCLPLVKEALELLVSLLSLPLNLNHFGKAMELRSSLMFLFTLGNDALFTHLWLVRSQICFLWWEDALTHCHGKFMGGVNWLSNSRNSTHLVWEIKLKIFFAVVEHSLSVLLNKSYSFPFREKCFSFVRKNFISILLLYSVKNKFKFEISLVDWILN